jgi:hypothetical protein
MYNLGPVVTFTAGVALEPRRRVKIKSGTTTTPAEVEYAGLGEQAIGVTEYGVAAGETVAVRSLNGPGIFETECIVSASIVRGTVLYGAASGKVSDASSGSAEGIATEPGANGQLLSWVPYGVLSTTAATVSVADSNGNMTGATVEAVLNEIEVALKTAQYTINPSAILLATGAPLAVFADAEAAVPGTSILSSKELGVRWNDHATPNAIAVAFVLPQDYDDSAAIIAHFEGAIIKAGGGETDSPTLTVEAYFSSPGVALGAAANKGGTSGEFLTAATNTWQEKTLTIAAADTPAAPGLLTLLVKPTAGELGTDDFALLPPWLEVTRQNLTT